MVPIGKLIKTLPLLLRCYNKLGIPMDLHFHYNYVHTCTSLSLVCYDQWGGTLQFPPLVIQSRSKSLQQRLNNRRRRRLLAVSVLASRQTPD